jgi:hypothetical protein
MKFNFTCANWRFVMILSAALFVACADAPKPIATNEPASSTSGSSQSAAGQSSSGIAVGHGSGSAPTSTGATVPMQSGGGSGLKWTPPSTWENKGASGMRAATYIAPPAKGDPEGAECAVFDGGIGGGVQANIDRWIGQFEQADGSSSANKAKQSKETINGMTVTMVDLTGVFAGGGMAMGQPSTKKPGYRLLGAIVEAPGGEVFFKMTGPAKTMAEAQADFQKMLKSISK